ncbi:GAF domain-containing protein [Chloroflexota bacterium]
MTEAQQTNIREKNVALDDIRPPLYILNVVAIITASFLLAFEYLPSLPDDIVSTIVAGVILIVSILGMFFTYRSRTTAAAIILMTILFISASAIGYNFRGLRNPVIYGLYLLLVPLTSLYLQRRNIIIVVGIIMLGIIGMQAGGAAEISSMIQIGVDEFVVVLVSIATAASLIDFTTRRLQTAIERSKKGEAEAVQANIELTRLTETLEQQVESRTADLETRNRYLETINQIAHEANISRNEQQLLEQIVNLIAERLNYYHAGIFLVDSNNEWAELKAASSVGGKQMVARGHRLQVGKQGIVGYVTGIGQPRITQATSMDRVHAITPELPDTRAEMALPLKARGEILGALDIQDTQEFAFTEDTVAVMQTLADQIALAIDNLRLLVQAQQSLEEAQRAYGDYSRKAWIEAQRSGTLPSYHFQRESRTGPSKISSGSLPSLEGKNKFEFPIQVRGLTIGVIDIAKSAGTEEWTLEEKELMQSLTDQLGIALDSARLFLETQQRAATEQIITEISTEVRETLDIDSILITAAERIRETLKLPEVSIRFATQTDHMENNGAGQPDSGQPEQIQPSPEQPDQQMTGYDQDTRPA